MATHGGRNLVLGGAGIDPRGAGPDPVAFKHDDLHVVLKSTSS